MIKALVKRTPVVRDVARLVLTMLASHGRKSFVSGDYWEQRYAAGGNSGAGSYNRLAEYKAGVLNKFVADHQVLSVIEFGSGDGAQLELAHYPRYTGVDVSRTVLELCRQRFAGDSSKRFIHSDEVTASEVADLALSLDVIYHLIEDGVFERYMSQLFDAATRFVIVYSSNSDRKADAVHVRHRIFTDWVRCNRPDFRLTGQEDNPYPERRGQGDDTSFANFHFFEKVAS